MIKTNEHVNKNILNIKKIKFGKFYPKQWNE